MQVPLEKIIPGHLNVEEVRLEAASFLVHRWGKSGSKFSLLSHETGKFKLETLALTRYAIYHIIASP